jgi:hypothetical protein
MRELSVIWITAGKSCTFSRSVEWDMNGNVARFLKIALSSAGLVVLGCVLTTQASLRPRHSLPTDWSHKHLVFSRPASPEAAARLANEPRYWQQIDRRERMARRPESIENDVISRGRFPFPFPFPVPRRLPKPKPSGGFWSIALGDNANPGAGMYPAKFTFQSDVFQCADGANPDYVVYSTGLAGGASQASIVAFDNLYSGTCNGTTPLLYWAYNTGGAVLTSPALSVDGSQIAFVQTNAGAASLVLLQWKASNTDTVTAPTSLTSTLATTYRTCAAPCMTTLPLLSGGATPAPTDDTTASVFIDYTHDVAWVADSGGWIHKFNGVFKGTPAEASTPWPVQLNPTSPKPALSPVFDGGSTLDPGSQKLFVTDQGGFLYEVDPTSGGVTQSGQLDFGPAGFGDGPLVDSSGGAIFVFASSDGSTACSGGPCARVYLFTPFFVAGGLGTSTTVVGNSATPPNPLYIGGFDSSYFTSLPRVGNMYVCGGGLNGGNPSLWQLQLAYGIPHSDPIANTTLVSSMSTLTSTPACSPVTDFAQPATAPGSLDEERVFLSPQNDALPDGCGGSGCLVSMVTAPWLPNTNWSGGQIILDSNLGTMIVINSGRSGATVPAWPGRFNTAGQTVTDGTVTWLDQGSLTAASPPTWTAGNAYGVTNKIIDSNGKLEAVISGGTSGATQPSWSTPLDSNTNDNGVIWVNLGPPPVNVLPVAGGTSGVIVDNGILTTPGNSQVYFGTLGNQATCATSGSPASGCAVQASQSDLQ